METALLMMKITVAMQVVNLLSWLALIWCAIALRKSAIQFRNTVQMFARTQQDRETQLENNPKNGGKAS